jgi:hypothetical protein
MSDIEFILSETERFGILLEDYISRKNILELKNWAFEWAYRESRYHKLDCGSTNILHRIREYCVLRDAFSLLLDSLDIKNDATELMFVLPPTYELSNLIHSNKIANRAISRRLKEKEILEKI